MNNKLLVTGGAGFIGSHIVEELLDVGYFVTVLDDFSTGKVENLPVHLSRLSIVKGSILDEEKVKTSMSGCFAVVHLAAIASVQQSVDNPLATHRVNFDGTFKLLEEARRQGVRRFLYASSAAVYGDKLTSAAKEVDPNLPLTPYAIDKLSGEYYLNYYSRTYGIKSTACRFFNVYGPRQDPLSPYSGVISIFMNRAQARKKIKIFGDGLQTRDFIYVKDLAKILVGFIDNEKCYEKVINIGTGKSVSLLDLVVEVGKALNVRVDIGLEQARVGDIRHSLADVTLLGTLGSVKDSTSLSSGLASILK